MKRARRLLGAIAVASVAAVTATARAEGPAAGVIRGTVYDEDLDAPLEQVRVSVLEVLMTAVTGPDGRFLIEHVPPGRYTLSLARDGYERRLLPEVVVTPGQLTDVQADLTLEVMEMDEMVVTGVDLIAGSETGLLDIRAEASTVQDAVSADLMSRAGVGEVAGALKLVVGASVVDGKYATVRGLSDRYTGTTLNGIRLPSADPRRRAAQVDLFPTGTIESITVTKTFTPDLLGDFTGGGVDIRTRSIPEETILSFSGSTEHNTWATGNSDFLTYTGGGAETFGFHGSDRELPGAARSTSLPSLPRFRPAPTPAEIAASKAYDELVRSFTPVMGVSTVTPEPNHGLSLSAGTTLTFDGDRVLGVLGSITYAHKYDFYEGADNNNASKGDPRQPIALDAPRTDRRGLDEVLLGGLASFVLKPSAGHELSLRLIANQSSEDEARFQVQDLGAGLEEQNQTLRYTERSVGSAQLHGAHTIGLPSSKPEGPGTDAMVDWTASWSYTKQDEPDVRFFRSWFDATTLGGSKPANSTDPQNTRRIFREVGEDDLQGAVNLSLPFRLSTGTVDLKTGVYRQQTSRGYDQRSFTYVFALPQVGYPVNAAAVENFQKGTFTAKSRSQLWTDVFLFGGRVGLAGNGQPAPNQLLWVIQPLGTDVNYDGDQAIDAVYAMAEVPLSGRMRLTGGARYETTRLEIVPENKAFGLVEVIGRLPSGDREISRVSETEAEADISEGSLLPSLGIVYAVSPAMNLRGSWSRTLARPTFRELAPVATEEFIFGDEYLGNPELELTGITNYDLRWEWFFRQGEVLALSGFYKELRDPIELISFSAGGRTFVQPVNFERGEVRGFELEARAGLSRLASWLAGFSCGVNFTRIDSAVEIPREERASLASFGLEEDARRLQGQPEYLFNANLGYDNTRTGTSVSVFYSLTGETLVTGSARGANNGNPSVFDERLGALDLTASQKMGRFSFSFKAKNLLTDVRRSVYRTPQGEEAIKSSRRTPALLSLSLSWAL